MDSRLRSIGVLLAGGVGQRAGLGRPKQLAEVAGRTIIEHSLAVFEAAPEIDEIVVLMTPGYADQIREIVERGGYRKVSKIVDGGASRTESTWRALRALGDEECDVLLHDAVRPLLEPRIITECVRALETHQAVNVAIPSSDTVLVAEPVPDGEVIGEVLDRSRLRRSQTPQCFRLSVIREAYERAFADPEFGRRPATDDCGVVLRYLPDVPIHLVPGSEHNIKVTHPADLHIAELLFELPKAVPAGDRRALAGQSVVVLGDTETAELAAAQGARVHAFSRADGVRVEDFDSVAKALDGVGGVDHVVSAPVAAHLDGLADEAAGVDHLGALNVARAARPHLRGSLLLQVPRGSGALHASTAAALTGLTRALAREWAADGIRVNCVNTAASPLLVAQTSLDILISDLSGQVIDVRVDGA
ncbi:bifunctional cytidylyltransferase/SDR family oxidoreductase [Nonomuraea jiangxiensis]|uniref:2-C-methyl-D-erythritol 4-phosphate cytidylyltransferase n=1 Tax=Nonomuraea jiangxiensis TaxID=633440 RepID=A0A1G8F878_9ACTN|nr:bifunctional cytidylyltransferase/SDR family oxidoreductase [Nonomuraea jiangxiensis]SDH78297.1 2-C-methyl-D-erythritol 4-phosphate cytidylyltransferase [Nonomuraea jiangxiensis]